MATSSIRLAVTASAVASAAFAPTKENQTIVVQVVGMDSTNKAYLQMWDIIAAGWVNVKINGSTVYCDINNNFISISGCNRYRINKDATTATVGVAVVSLSEINLF